MGRGIRILFVCLACLALEAIPVFGQKARPAPRGGAPNQVSGPQWTGFNPAPYVGNYFYPTFGNGGYYSPFFYQSSPVATYPYVENYWWVSRYPIADPRQEGYNPSAGYAPETVTTLLLDTTPAKARITLDGVYVGTTDALGPFQLPIGEHSLRVDAASYVPSETILKIEKPGTQILNVSLRPVAIEAKPAPRI